MKKYIKPECEDINVASQEVMTTGMSLRIFDEIPGTGNYNDYIITDGSEILTGKSHLWDDEEEDESWR